MKKCTTEMMLWEKGDIARTPYGLCIVEEDEEVVSSSDIGYLHSTVSLKVLEEGEHMFCAGAVAPFDRHCLAPVGEEEKKKALELLERI